MGKSKSARKQKGNPETTTTAGQVDIVFAGPLLFVPSVADGKVTGLEVFSPRNGHHIGAVFVPGVLFSDAELNDPHCARWPEPGSFSLLDPHSYSIELTQSPRKRTDQLAVASIPGSNHKVKPGRRLSADWEVSIAIQGQISAWSSHRLAKVTEGLFHGADMPTNEQIASLHRLSYFGVTAAELYGAAKEPRDYLRTNIGRGGTLIVIGEIPYQATLLHERQAIDAIAKLAGLELHLADTSPSPFRDRMMSHPAICGHSIILV
jgi:hypothetical protein